jgi:hypothetical protein
MSNPFDGVGSQLNGLVHDLLPVTPSNSTDLPDGLVAIGLYITVGGTVTFHNVRGIARTITVPDNFYLVCGTRRVLSSGTTATGINALVA